MNSTGSSNLETFRDKGYFKMANAINLDLLMAIKKEFESKIAQEFGINLDDSNTWFSNPYNPAGGSRARRLSGMNPIMRSMAKELKGLELELISKYELIFGKDKWLPLDLWYSLLSFPGTESRWNVPHDSWHADLPIVEGDHQPWCLFSFVFLDNVDRNTGPTLMIEGSHRCGQLLVQTLGTSDPEQVEAFSGCNSGLVPNPSKPNIIAPANVLPPLIERSKWFQELTTNDGEEDRIEKFIHSGGDFDGVAIKVVELTGNAGDIIIFDPRCLHSFSANISKQARQIIRLDFRRQA